MATNSPATPILNGNPIRNRDSADPGPVVFADEALGGHHQKDTIEERNAITVERRKKGMTCHVAETGITYRLDEGIENSNWVDVLAPTNESIQGLNQQVSNHNGRLNGMEIGSANSFPTAAELPTTLNNTGAVQYFEVYKDPATSNNGRYYKDPGTSLCFKVTSDSNGRLVNLETVTDVRRQLKSRNALVADADGRVLMWQVDGRINFRPSEEVVTEVLESGNIDLRQQTATKIALFVDGAGRVPLWLEDGKLAAGGFSDGLLGYLNTALNIGDPTITRWVIFVTIGQSNMLGLSNDSSNWLNASDVGRKWEYNNTLVPLVEPVGTSAPTGRTSTGSMLPAFALEYARLNPGVGVIIVPCASNGTTSAQWRADATVPVYDDVATLFSTAVTRLKACIAAVKADSAYADVRLGGALYYQGESDSATVPATYRANLQNTIDGLRDPANFGPDFPVFLGITGHVGTESTYRALRAEQRSFAIQTPYVYPAFEGMQFYLDASGAAGTRDGTHFKQTMYNIIGKCLAATVARSPIPTAPLK